MNYYYADHENQVIGPFSAEQLRELYQSGTLSPETNVILEGTETWKSYRSTFPTPPPPPVINLVPVPYKPLLPANAPLQVMSATKECPFCAEQILTNAKKCKHCGETLDVALRAAEEAKRIQPQQPMVFMNAATSSAAVVASKRGFPHLLNLIFTVLTAGFWFPIWILLYIFRNRRVYY